MSLKEFFFVVKFKLFENIKSKKMKKLSNLAWIDLEMTGLDPQNDVIVEIASIVTDKDLNILAQGPSFVINQSIEKLEQMSDFVRNLHTNSGLLEQIKTSTITIKEAQEKSIEFFDTYCFTGVAPLCGNSVWQDRRFLRKYMPELDNFFNYRIIDVSSIKEVIKRWYPDNPFIKYTKHEIHRALPDIQESVAELNHYRKNFFIK